MCGLQRLHQSEIPRPKWDLHTKPQIPIQFSTFPICPEAFCNHHHRPGQNVVTSWFLCREYLTTNQCSDCVSKILEMANNLCPNTVSTRVQLTGCYLRYEISRFKQISGSKLLYKLCGSIKASGIGFDEKRDTAFEMMEYGVKSESSLFYTGTCQSVYVLAQCEGDLGADDCGDCVKNA